jgi:hypothetical protein
MESQNPKRFAKEVLPHHFKTTNFNSFVRQLNFYGFRKVNSNAEEDKNVSTGEEGNKTWVFAHSSFMRGRPDLMKNIKRKTYSDHANSASKEEMDVLRSELEEKYIILDHNNSRMHELETKCSNLKNEIKSIKQYYSKQLQCLRQQGGKGLYTSEEEDSEEQQSLNPLGREGGDIPQFDLWNMEDSVDDYGYTLEFEINAIQPLECDPLQDILIKIQSEENKIHFLLKLKRTILKMFPHVDQERHNVDDHQDSYSSVVMLNVKYLLNQLDGNVQASLAQTVWASVELEGIKL